jgi:transcriptional antiterminator RfaH
MKWFVLYTRSRWEKKVEKNLLELGVDTYCPTITEERQWSDRKKKVTSPLFKSYVFVKIDEARRDMVFEIPGVVKYLYWLGKPAVVKEKEIELIKSWLEDEMLEEISVTHLSPGDKVQIANGSFKGKEAIVSKVGKKRIKLLLQSLDLVVNVKTKDVLV